MMFERKLVMMVLSDLSGLAEPKEHATSSVLILQPFEGSEEGHRVSAQNDPPALSASFVDLERPRRWS